MVDLKCPRCGYFQKFGKRRRKISENESEIYIQCKGCRWKHVVIRGSDAMIDNYREIQKLRGHLKSRPELEDVLERRLRKHDKFMAEGRPDSETS